MFMGISHIIEPPLPYSHTYMDGFEKILSIISGFYSESIDDHIFVFILMVMVLLDIGLGICKAWSLHDIQSRKMRPGIVSHSFILLFVGVLYPFVSLIGLSEIADVLVMYLNLSYLASILSNLKVLGVRIPFIDKMIEERLDTYKYYNQQPNNTDEKLESLSENDNKKK